MDKVQFKVVCIWTVAYVYIYWLMDILPNRNFQPCASQVILRDEKVKWNR